jgi:hypothetical protein
MAASAKGYFSSNLESVRKDVESTFGIMKKRYFIQNMQILTHKNILLLGPLHGVEISDVSSRLGSNH